MKSNILYSIHAKEMLIEREINPEWVNRTVENPDFKEIVSLSEVHYVKQIIEFENRFLRVVVNNQKIPSIIVTFFFDRRLKRK